MPQILAELVDDLGAPALLFLASENPFSYPPQNGSDSFSSSGYVNLSRLSTTRPNHAKAANATLLTPLFSFPIF